jgi:AcrR family transcriptional regulator
VPKVSDTYRRIRRDEIVAATIRVISRRGLRALTMADIIKESGLSAGSVYSHFRTKHEIIELVAAQVIGERAERLSAAADDTPRPPLEVVRWWMTDLDRGSFHFGAVLQIWAEAASDSRIRAVVERRMTEIEDAFTAAAGSWLIATGGDPSAARATGRAMLMVCQGYIVRSAALGPQDLAASIAAVELLK